MMDPIQYAKNEMLLDKLKGCEYTLSPHMWLEAQSQCDPELWYAVTGKVAALIDGQRITYEVLLNTIVWEVIGMLTERFQLNDDQHAYVVSNGRSMTALKLTKILKSMMAAEGKEKLDGAMTITRKLTPYAVASILLVVHLAQWQQ